MSEASPPGDENFEQAYKLFLSGMNERDESLRRESRTLVNGLRQELQQQYNVEQNKRDERLTVDILAET